MQEFSLLENWWQFLILAVISYGVGCINFALLISRAKKNDITKIGSGNPGTMNMSREFGWKIGVLTFLGDALKGFVPVLAAHLLYRDSVFLGTQTQVSDFARYFCGLLAILGHVFPVTMKFKGGKGIATTFGVFWAALTCERVWLFPVVFAVFIGILFFIFLTEWGSLGSLFGVVILSCVQAVIFFLRYEETVLNAYTVGLFIMLFAIVVLTWAAHYQNLGRLLSGEEHRTSLKKIVKKAKK